MSSSTPLKHIFFTLLLLPSIIFASVGKITVSSGDVTVQRAGKVIKGISNTSLEEKDAIFTKVGSSAQIILSDGTALSLGANTNLKIQEYLFDEKAKNANLKVGIAEGAFRSITGKIGKISPEKFKVETRTATIGIRGTTFLGVIPKEGPETIVCARGVISVTPNPVQIPGATTAPRPVAVVVKAGEITKASAGTVEPPRPYTKAELQNLEKAITVDSKKSDAAPAVTSSEEKKADSGDKNPNGGGDRGTSQVSTITMESSFESIKKSVESAIKDIVGAKNSEKIEPQTQQTQTTSETTTATTTTQESSATTPSALASAKARGDVYTLGKALLSKDSAQQSEAASLMAGVPTSSPSSYTVLSSADSQLLNNALKVTYGATTKYFKYASNTNTYGTDITFTSMSDLVAKLNANVDSTNVKFYLDSTTNQVSYGMTTAATSLSVAKVNSGNFLGFAGSPTARTGDMNFGRSVFGMTKLNDGRVFAFGGKQYTPTTNWQDNTIPEIYDPATGLWTQKTAQAMGNMSGAQAITLNNGNVLVVGEWGDGSFNKTYIYDTAHDTWSISDTTSNPGFGAAFAKTSDGTVYGFNGNLVKKYDGTGWSSVATTVPAASYPGTYDNTLKLFTAGINVQLVEAVTLSTASGASFADKILLFGGYFDAYDSNRNTYLFDPSGATTWTKKADMLMPTARPSSTLLNDGNVLAIGGQGKANRDTAAVNLNTIQMYNPSSDTWSYKVPLPFAYLSGNKAVTLDNGSVLIAGGIFSSDTVMSSSSNQAYIYNPTFTSATTTAPTTGSLQHSRTGLAMTKLLDGTVFAVGGFNYDQINRQWVPEQIYNPATGLWTTTASTNNPSTGTYSRMGLGATTLSSGKVLIAGGNDGWGWFFNNVDLYDTSTHTWTTQTPLPTILGGLGLVGINGGANALAIGGSDGTTTFASVLRFDPTANGGLGSWTSVASMNTARSDLGAVTIQDGNVLAIGGSNAGGYLNSVEYYNIAGDTWTYKANMLTPRNSLSATLLQDGTVLAIGGMTTGDTPLSSVEQYNPTTDTWQYKVPLPFTLAHSSAVTLNDGSVLIAGGNLNAVTTATSWIYNPSQAISSNINTILAKDYNAGINNGFFIGSTSNMSSSVFGTIGAMLFSAEPSAAGIDVNTNSGQLNGALGSLSGVTGVGAFNFAHYTTPTTSMVSYSGEDNKIIWGEAVVDGKSSTIGFASLPDKVDSGNSLASVGDFSSWGYWEAMSTDGTQYHSGYWVSGQPTPVEYINQMVAQNQTFSYSGHVIGDTLNASSVKDAIVLDVNNKIDMSVKFGSANPITVTALKFSTSQGWSYNQSANLTNTSSTISGNGYTAALGNSVNTSDALSMQGKFYGPQVNSTGGAFAGKLTGADATQRDVEGVYKARR